jgi:hypothetical protein
MAEDDDSKNPLEKFSSASSILSPQAAAPPPLKRDGTVYFDLESNADDQPRDQIDSFDQNEDNGVENNDDIDAETVSKDNKSNRESRDSEYIIVEAPDGELSIDPMYIANQKQDQSRDPQDEGIHANEVITPLDQPQPSPEQQDHRPAHVLKACSDLYPDYDSFSRSPLLLTSSGLRIDFILVAPLSFEVEQYPTFSCCVR